MLSLLLFCCRSKEQMLYSGLYRFAEHGPVFQFVVEPQTDSTLPTLRGERASEKGTGV